MTTEDEIRRRIEHGNRFPYDAPNDWLRKSDPPARDWAHSAARGILADLNDRSRIKHALADIDQETKDEIVETRAAIIRLAHKDYQ